MTANKRERGFAGFLRMCRRACRVRMDHHGEPQAAGARVRLADWTEWSPEAEAVHGISLVLLREQGTPRVPAARRVVEVLGDERARMVSDAPGISPGTS